MSDYWTRFHRSRLNRRRFLAGAGAAGAGVAAFGLVGCGDDDNGGSSNNGGGGGGGNTPSGGGGGGTGKVPDGHQSLGSTAEDLRQQFHWSLLQNVPGQGAFKTGGKFTFAGFDPGNWSLTDPGASIMSSFAGHHYNGLITFPMSDYDNAHKLAPEGDLAKNWEQPDNLTYIFHLNEGVKWQDVQPTNGRAMTAQDVVYGYKLLQDKSSFQKDTYADVQSIEAPDEKTVTFKMKQPAAYLLNNMMVPVHVIAPKELVDNPDKFKATAVGTGPFILDSWEPNGTWKAHKNPTYFRKWKDKQLPFIDQIESRNFIGNDAGRIAAFRSGELDTLWGLDKNNFLDLLKESPDFIGQVTTPPPGAQNYISMHVERAPWNDPKLRQALSLAIDRNAIHKGVLEELSGPGYSQDWSFFKDKSGNFREWPWDENELGDYHHYDVQKAKQLYSAAGYSDSKPLKIKYNYSSVTGPSQDLHLLILQNWKDNLGVQAEFVGMETVGWIGAHYSRAYDDALGSWFSGPAFDPDGYAQVLRSGSPSNIYGVNDPDLDKILDQQRTELDYTKRADLLQQIMLKDLNQCYRIWTRNAYKTALRKKNYFNVVDTIHAWGNIGWGAKGDEKVWIA